nr:hypothetical protein [Candidatus Freyarchaeota archaeon]
MIKAFYVLLKTGESLFYKVYGRNHVDESLFSGFLGAVYNFAREIGHGDIQTMEMGDAKVICEVSGNLIFVVVVEKDDDEQEIKNFLSSASKTFLNRFREELEGWRGNVTVFRPFAKELDHIAENYQVKRLPGKVKLAPFLREDTSESSACPFDVEIASVFSLLEDVRNRGGGLLRKKPEEELTGVIRVLWPFWILPYNDGDKVVVVDAMSAGFLRIKVKRSQAMENVKSLLKVKDVDAFVTAFENLLLDSKNEIVEEFSLHGFLDPEVVKNMEICLSQAKLSETKGYVVPRPLINPKRALESKKGFSGLVEELNKHYQKLVENDNLIASTAEKWLKKIQEKMVEIKETYQIKIEETTKDVEKQIENLMQFREEELKNIDAWFTEEDKNLVLEIKNLFGPLLEVLEDVALKSTEEIEKRVDTRISLSEIIDERIEKLANVAEYMDKTKKVVENISKSIKKIDSTIEKITKKTEADKTLVIQDFDKKIVEQNSRIDKLKEELEDAISTQQELMNKVTTTLKELRESCKKKLEEIDELIKRLNSQIIKSPEKTYSPSIFYVPLYISKFQDLKKERFYVVPQLLLLKSKAPNCDFGQKTLPLDLPNSQLFETIKERVEKLINENKELRTEIEKGFNKTNLINSQQIETCIYDGLDNLLSLNILNEKNFQTLKARVADIFRKEQKI